MSTLILASSSIGRSNLLKSLGITFHTLPSRVDEDRVFGKTPHETIRLRAKLKGEDVAEKIYRSLGDARRGAPPAGVPLRVAVGLPSGRTQTVIILSADSDAILNNRLYSRPKSFEEAFKILKALSGHTHEFVTAVNIIKIEFSGGVGDTGGASGRAPGSAHPERSRGGALTERETRGRTRIFDDYSRSLVTFRRISDKEIEFYLSHTEYKRFAGSYALAGCQDFITRIEGSISNVIGLPLEKVIPVFRKLQLLSG
jgi:septum formation protein